MNVEFHYYTIYALALEAGLPPDAAGVLAGASQEIDASTTPLRLDGPQGTVEVTVTQNYAFWDQSVGQDVYLPYHFIPGDRLAAASRRRDGREHPLAVTPNATIAKELLVMALRDRDLYLAGIAMHSFADTWAHQNFCGIIDDYNNAAEGTGLPPAGHLQVLTSPDDPAGRWHDGRLVPEYGDIDNRERFAEAAGKLYRYLCVYRGKSFADEQLVIDKLRALWARQNRDERLADYVIGWDIAPWEAGAWRREAGAPVETSALSRVRHYDKLAWAGSVIAGDMKRPRVVQVDSSVYSSHLYRWNEAALEHRRRAASLMAGAGLPC